MDLLRPFFMEDYLEGSRFTARYNLGESGARPVTVGELLTGSGVSPSQAADVFLSTLLRDSPNWGRADLRDLVARPGRRVKTKAHAERARKALPWAGQRAPEGQAEGGSARRRRGKASGVAERDGARRDERRA